jgi:hypothetical protein
MRTPLIAASNRCNQGYQDSKKDVTKCWIYYLLYKDIKKLTQLLHYLKYFDTEPIVMGDGHKEIRDAVEDFTREGLIKGPKYAIVRQNGNEFEDLFESNRLVKAMKKVCGSKLRFELTTEELEAERKSRKAADILEDYMIEKP